MIIEITTEKALAYIAVALIGCAIFLTGVGARLEYEAWQAKMKKSKDKKGGGR